MAGGSVVLPKTALQPIPSQEEAVPDKPLRNLKTRLADGLAAWLAFEFACERGYLFSEYYLAHAVGQILRAGGPNVRAEEPHPTLAVPGKTGRPPSIDFTVYDEHNKPTLAVETKWAGFTDVTAGALAWDAFRLEAFAKRTGAPGLLIFGGTLVRLDALFSSSAFKRVGKGATDGARLFPLPTGSRSFVLHRRELSAPAARYVADKIAKSPSDAVAHSVYCEAPQFSRGVGPKSITFGVYVWEIGVPRPLGRHGREGLAVS